MKIPVLLAFGDGLTAMFLALAVVLVALGIVAASNPTKPESILARKRLMGLCVKLALIIGSGFVLLALR